MSFARLLKFALFGHATAAVACYELGKHKPHGYLRKETTAAQVKTRAERTAKYETLAVIAAALVIQPEAAVLMVAYSIPVYTYYLGRYQALAAEEQIKAPSPMPRKP